MKSRYPNETRVSLKTVQHATFAAVAHFNDGNDAYVNVLKQLGVNLECYIKSMCKKQNAVRIKQSNRRSSALVFFLVFVVFSCIFILLSRESDQCAKRARLEVVSHLSTTPRWGNFAKCLSQRHK